MPHCIIDCPATLAQRIGEHTLLTTVHDALDSFGLFKPGDIKVRLNGFTHYRCGTTQDDFVHVALYLFAGRSAEQQRSLASATLGALIEVLPQVEALSMDVREMPRETFVNRSQYLEEAGRQA
ncbi:MULTISPECIES: 5-carboxymethyl-2-hydroxymuconate Delta-isomerase [Pseudomonas fluorescens group]|uniref:5-carboxymethyl-2-hydroxymuconate isomerase n=3 Tax=Pseudomonas fluorescens group TaxID=136843 RepID=A0A3M4AFQ3_PSEMA|nr:MULTISPECIES: 5-carboxymethyl-2-hydroxymuconate Delta-isomerase [Pseudomonas fluorescens group]MCD7041090.1 5-carboxymethyl-2-hydroxymuconate Delta-isomerase [Pseudomonas petroselini]MCD7048317.1 5-carboxymethyl-2-hydroxymuconate Delta-isomerase [Pseudomonas petroselini]MCD7067989.1 5-carboxymethyl-2-hydroxymuconate Delta-isomerase [Pseudomonas petroselini]MCD7077504.1 5-carboxymethyl-2-hydroxymuconate Delta-isomerase [Pseudomonas petroselini]MCF5663838.1 5-carboxymethyl-2-hydroxymuconate i